MPMIVGHRGYSAKYPENSVASLLAALLYGADGVEFDVRISRDGVPIVIHDESTGRVSTDGVDLRVKDEGSSRLTSIKLGMGQYIPTLAEVLTALPPNTLVFLEIKELEAVEAAYETVRKAGRLRNTVFMSFYYKSLVRLREIDESVRLGYIIANPQRMSFALKLLKDIRLTSINPSIDLMGVVGKEKFTEYLVKIHGMGAETAVWVINELNVVKPIINHVDYIVTDEVAKIRSELEELRQVGYSS